MRRGAPWSVLVVFLVLTALPALAATPWAARYVEAKRALGAGEYAACLAAVTDGYEVAPDDRRAGVALVGARCAAGAGDRVAFETWSALAGDKLTGDEARALKARLAAHLSAEALAKAEPTTGALRIESQPAGASIRLDGRDLGLKTPAEVPDLAPGRHLVRLGREGYEARTEEVGVVAGQTGEVSVRLSKVVVPAPAPVPALVPAPVPAATRPSAPRPGLTPHPSSSSGEGGSREGGSVEGSAGSVWTSAALGAVVAEGTAVRGHASLELGGAWHLGAVRLDLALASTLEAPTVLFVRPGLRAFLGPVYGRVAYQLAAAPAAGGPAHGALLGLGGELALGDGWFLVTGADVGLWFSAIDVVPVEGRLGVGRGW